MPQQKDRLINSFLRKGNIRPGFTFGDPNSGICYFRVGSTVIDGVSLLFTEKKISGVWKKVYDIDTLTMALRGQIDGGVFFHSFEEFEDKAKKTFRENVLKIRYGSSYLGPLPISPSRDSGPSANK